MFVSKRAWAVVVCLFAATASCKSESSAGEHAGRCDGVRMELADAWQVESAAFESRLEWLRNYSKREEPRLRAALSQYTDAAKALPKSRANLMKQANAVQRKLDAIAGYMGALATARKRAAGVSDAWRVSGKKGLAAVQGSLASTVAVDKARKLYHAAGKLPVVRGSERATDRMRVAMKEARASCSPD